MKENMNKISYKETKAQFTQSANATKLGHKAKFAGVYWNICPGGMNLEALDASSFAGKSISVSSINYVLGL